MSTYPVPLTANDPHFTLADAAYVRLKQEIFNFTLVPGDRFTEKSVADKLGMSRTPVREALFRLQREGFLEVYFRSGWLVKPFNFQQFEHLYDLRMVLETASVRRLCETDDANLDNGPMHAALDSLANLWLVPKESRLTDPKILAEMDEQFHIALVTAAGNPEISRVHREVTERIRVIRRLDFTQLIRIEKTYEEHSEILRAIISRRADQALLLLRTHINLSKSEVRKITVHNLHMARETFI